VEDLEWKQKDKLKKIKGNEKIETKKQISEDFPRKHQVTRADLELGLYWGKKEKYRKDLDRWIDGKQSYEGEKKKQEWS
jgi:hypothetical protein